MDHVAIVGGGPGGLLTAYLLEQNYKDKCRVTLFESTERTGGKIHTRRFNSAPVIYESGLSELYDYRVCGPDPLFKLVQKLGLKTTPMHGKAVVLDGHLLRNRREIHRFGSKTIDAIDQFRQRAAGSMSRDDWYEGSRHFDNRHPWAHLSCEDILEEIADPVARKYLRVAVHSDLATEPHLTSALNGLKNFLMDVPGYLRLYSVAGGIEQVPRSLEKQLTARIRTGCRISKVEKALNGMYRVFWSNGGKIAHADFDALFIALPHNALGMVEWCGEPLRKAMTRFIAYYDQPGHYLRVSALFKRPFWRTLLRGSWFMLDAFGGCCVYDEGVRYGAGDYGVLSWLLAGNSAASMSNFRNGTLVDLVLDSLPCGLAREGRLALLEAKVHRWIASVSAQPGGFPIREFRSAHLPEAEQHPGIFMVGDYLFDSTLNGVLDSAQFATDLWHSWKLKQRILQRSAATNGFARKSHVSVDASGTQNRNGNRPRSFAKIHHNGKDPRSVLSKWSISRDYFDDYHDGHSYAETFHEYFDAKYVRDLIDIAWGAKPPYRLLDAGSANGLTLDEFAKCGIDAWGVERNKYIHNLTPRQLKKRNLLGDVRKLSFVDNSFDFVYETCLGYLPEGEVASAIKELQRVAKRGVIFGSITSDMNPKLFDRSNLVWGVKTLMTLWEWRELFLANGFHLAVNDRKTVASLWRCEKRYNAGDDDWYRDKQSLSYCFYSKRRDFST